MQERLNRQERKSQTRGRLLDAAAEVFAKRGIEAASLDEVAAAAGYTKGAVYSNFSSKTDLFIALIERRIEAQTAEHARRFEGLDPDAMARVLENSPDQETESERKWLLLAVDFWMHAMRDERAKALMAEQYERARTLTAELLARLYATMSEKPPFAPRDMAIVIESVGIGLSLQAALDPQAVRMSLQAEVISRLLGLGELPDRVGTRTEQRPDPAKSDPS
jgi:AcrR family transcriptional regulator